MKISHFYHFKETLPTFLSFSVVWHYAVRVCILRCLVLWQDYLQPSLLLQGEHVGITEQVPQPTAIIISLFKIIPLPLVSFSLDDLDIILLRLPCQGLKLAFTSLKPIQSPQNLLCSAFRSRCQPRLVDAISRKPKTIWISSHMKVCLSLEAVLLIIIIHGMPSSHLTLF